ncbi:hypothetical protein [Prevotella falsenii]|uniref:hypothetical protein n=1 Tax=Prevotella falsenii TaxID=515414 RepID=UPI0012EB2C30|nr:hypothetical protein [Prevotella falsenii]
MLLPLCFLTGLVHLPTSVQPLHLAVTRYASDETSAQLLSNRTKPVKDANDRLGLKRPPQQVYSCGGLTLSVRFRSVGKC